MSSQNSRLKKRKYAKRQRNSCGNAKTVNQIVDVRKATKDQLAKGLLVDKRQ